MSTLLTTLSILGRKDIISYYSAEINGEKYYATGISQQEIGTKYFLSDPSAKIDRIIVIGSDATYSKEDDLLEINDLRKSYDQLQKISSEKSASALSFYQYRIAQFLNGKENEEKSFENTINDQRKIKIQEIVKKYLEEKGILEKDQEQAIMTFEKSAFRPKDVGKEIGLYINDIRTRIKTDIEEGFVKPEQYENYEKVESLPELVAVRNEQQSLKEMTAGIEEIQKKLQDNRKNRTIEGEAYAVAAEASLEQARRILEVQKINSTDSMYMEVLDRITKTIHKLIEEIQSLRENRVGQETNYARYYLYECLPSEYKMSPVSPEQRVEMKFVPLKTVDDKEENLAGIVETIIGHKAGKEDLYIDMQGGSRTDGYVRNAVLSILNNEDAHKIEIKKFVATDWAGSNFVSPVVDETKRYQITDLVSGMNAFIQYGRADLIEKYVKEADIRDERTIQLVNQMIMIDHSLSVCNIDGLISSINELKAVFNNQNFETKDMIFSILEDGIKADYASLLDRGENDFAALARWAIRKNFVQQALTIIEAKMPDEFVSKGILYYSEGPEDIKKKKRVKNNIQNTAGTQSYRLKDFDHFFIKDYFMYNRKHNTYEYIDDSVQKKVKFHDVSDSQNAMIRYLYKNGWNEKNALSVYTKMPSLSQAINLRDRYMHLANARNLLNHASVDMDKLYHELGINGRPKENETAYDVIKKEIVNFLDYYAVCLKKIDQNIDVQPEKKKTFQRAAYKGVISNIYDLGYGMISSNDKNVDSPIQFLKNDMSPEKFASLQKGMSVKFEMVPVKEGSKVKKAVNITAGNN